MHAAAAPRTASRPSFRMVVPRHLPTLTHFGTPPKTLSPPFGGSGVTRTVTHLEFRSL
jgi:hypothetical protein